MEVTQEKWTEITVTVDTKDIETAGNIANMVVPYGIYMRTTLLWKRRPWRSPILI